MHPFRNYRLKYKPDDELPTLDVVPIIPYITTKNGLCHFKHDYHREIAWTIDYRGDNDDIPTLLYAGAGYTLVKKAFVQMFGKSSMLCNGLTLYRDFSFYLRQGRLNEYMAVEFKDFNSRVMTLQELGKVMENVMKRICWCNIKYVTLNKFLNI